MAVPVRIPDPTWSRRAPAFVLALLALVGHLATALHFAVHAHVYCVVHERMEHAGIVHADPATHGACCSDEHGDEDHEGDDDDGAHDPCGMQPPGKLADVPATILGALSDDTAVARALPEPSTERHGLDPLTMAPKRSPPLR